MHVSKAYLAIGVLSWPLLRGLLRVTPRGKEKLPKGGFVLSANHHSNFDPWALGFPLFPDRQVRFMAKAELFKPVLGSILRSAGAFPVRRGEGDHEGDRDGRRARARGRDRRHATPRAPGARRASRRSARRAGTPARRAIALAAGVPLVPAAIGGTDRLSQFPRVKVIYGDPIPLDDLADQDKRRASIEATERLIKAIAELEQQL